MSWAFSPLPPPARSSCFRCVHLVIHNASLSCDERKCDGESDPLLPVSLYLMAFLWDNPEGKSAIPSASRRAGDTADSRLGAHTARPPQRNTGGDASGLGWKGSEHRG